MEPENATSVNTVFNSIKTECDDFSNFCRVCMGRSVNMKPIFDTEPSYIVEKVEYCTGLVFTKEDGLPTHICVTCEQNLSVANKFKLSCLQADETFRKCLNRIKTEETETYDDHFDEHSDEEVNGVLKEVLKLNDVDIGKVKLKKECNNLHIKSKLRPRKRGTYKKKKDKPGPKKSYKKLQLKKFFCQRCDLKFETKEDTELHKKDFHKEDDTWVCEICGKMFIHRSSHYTHVRSHMPPKYECASCDYKTWHKHDLVKHTRIHAGIKLYQCELCPASYHTSSNLTSHIQRFHQGLKRFSCHLCERSFYDKTKLNRHVDAHNDIKRFECDVCHSFFARRCYWKKHLQRQHGVLVPATRPGRQKTNMLVGYQPPASAPNLCIT